MTRPHDQWRRRHPVPVDAATYPVIHWVCCQGDKSIGLCGEDMTASDYVTVTDSTDADHETHDLCCVCEDLIEVAGGRHCPRNPALTCPD